MIQEELENVLEARTAGGRPDGYMTDDERRYYDELYGSAPQPKQSSPSMSGGSQYGSPQDEELTRLRDLCKQGDKQACMDALDMEQFMYGQGDRMHEGKKKRKKNG